MRFVSILSTFVILYSGDAVKIPDVQIMQNRLPMLNLECNTPSCTFFNSYYDNLIVLKNVSTDNWEITPSSCNNTTPLLVLNEISNYNLLMFHTKLLDYIFLSTNEAIYLHRKNVDTGEYLCSFSNLTYLTLECLTNNVTNINAWGSLEVNGMLSKPLYSDGCVLPYYLNHTVQTLGDPTCFQEGLTYPNSVDINSMYIFSCPKPNHLIFLQGVMYDFIQSTCIGFGKWDVDLRALKCVEKCATDSPIIDEFVYSIIETSPKKIKLRCIDITKRISNDTLICDPLSGWSVMPQCIPKEKCSLRPVVAIPTLIRDKNGIISTLENQRPQDIYTNDAVINEVYDPVKRLSYKVECLSKDTIHPNYYNKALNYFDRARVSKWAPGPVDLDVMAVTNLVDNKFNYFVSISEILDSATIDGGLKGNRAIVRKMSNNQSYSITCYVKNNDFDTWGTSGKSYVLQSLARLIFVMCNATGVIEDSAIDQKICMNYTTSLGRKRYDINCIPCGHLKERVKYVVDVLHSFKKDKSIANINNEYVFNQLCADTPPQSKRKIWTLVIMTVVSFILFIIASSILAYTLWRSNRMIDRNHEKIDKVAQATTFNFASNMDPAKAQAAVRSQADLPKELLVRQPTGN